MNLYAKLPENDIAHITDYIEAYAGIDGDGISMKADLDYILRFWDKNKEDLFKIFGGKFILTKSISYTKPLDILEEEMNRVIRWDGPGRQYYEQFQQFVEQFENDTKWKLCELMYSHSLATNTYIGETFSFPNRDNTKKITVQSGCKVSKMLGKIASEYSLKGYEDFRIAHSMGLNQKQLKGELCISIHPLDYMTMSDNNSSWSSCMSWRETGDYRQGTVEMMNSPCVVVAYLKGTYDMSTVGSHEWNNKKWRQLFIVTPEFITGIRQYPYNSDELNGITLQWLRDLAQTNGAWGPYCDTAVIVKNNTTVPIASLDKSVYFDVHTHFMYNDFYANHLSYVSESIPEDYALCFSGESECMKCGEDCSGYDTGDMEACALCCPDCEDIFYCSECGERVSSCDLIEIDGSRVCHYCYENYYQTCILCEETHHENYSQQVYLREEPHHDSNNVCYSIRICEDCLNSDKFIALFGKAETIPYGRWNHKYVVDLKNLTLEGLEYFDVWSDTDYEDFKNAIMQRALERSAVHSIDEN